MQLSWGTATKIIVQTSIFQVVKHTFENLFECLGSKQPQKVNSLHKCFHITEFPQNLFIGFDWRNLKCQEWDLPSQKGNFAYGLFRQHRRTFTAFISKLYWLVTVYFSVMLIKKLVCICILRWKAYFFINISKVWSYGIVEDTFDE